MGPGEFIGHAELTSPSYRRALLPRPPRKPFRLPSSLTWNAALESGGFLVSDKIRLELDISAVKVPATA